MGTGHGQPDPNPNPITRLGRADAPDRLHGIHTHDGGRGGETLDGVSDGVCDGVSDGGRGDAV